MCIEREWGPVYVTSQLPKMKLGGGQSVLSWRFTRRDSGQEPRSFWQSKRCVGFDAPNKTDPGDEMMGKTLLPLPRPGPLLFLP